MTPTSMLKRLAKIARDFPESGRQDAAEVRVNHDLLIVIVPVRAETHADVADAHNHLPVSWQIVQPHVAGIEIHPKVGGTWHADIGIETGPDGRVKLDACL